MKNKRKIAMVLMMSMLMVLFVPLTSHAVNENYGLTWKYANTNSPLTSTDTNKTITRSELVIIKNYLKNHESMTNVAISVNLVALGYFVGPLKYAKWYQAGFAAGGLITWYTNQSYQFLDDLLDECTDSTFVVDLTFRRIRRGQDAYYRLDEVVVKNSY